MNQQELNDNLIKAAGAGDVDRVKTLLQAPASDGSAHCADVHLWDGLALYCAAFRGDTETVKVLLQAGANIHARDDLALRWAAENGRTETVKVLLRAGANSACLYFHDLRGFLTPQFILSLSQELMTAVETSHPELKEQYKYWENKSLLKTNDKENGFDAKISLADLYYRPGGPGYYQAIAIN